MNFVFLILHVLSVITGVAAGFLWMRSANVNVPAIRPSKKLREPDGTLSSAWVNEVAENLDLHRKALMKATKYNKGAATAAAVAALAQAAVYVLNVFKDVTAF